ncbi:MAG: hypothetical protein BGN97_05700 [Microbacterium sp. 69-10]|nr:MAG: hypothetical protein BGN97_05700 [Microbacterium sp. 69-10]
MTGTHEQFACPVPWCAGYVWDHGGDGLSGPEDWMHSSERKPLGGLLWAVRGAVGSGPEFWSVYVGGDENAVGTEVPDPEQLALTLERAAQRLREVARPAASCAGD